MSITKPFNNESETCNIGGLTLENRVDKVSIFGSLDITKDAVGLQRAVALTDALLQIVDELKRSELPEAITNIPTVKVEDPFK